MSNALLSSAVANAGASTTRLFSLDGSALRRRPQLPLQLEEALPLARRRVLREQLTHRLRRLPAAVATDSASPFCSGAPPTPSTTGAVTNSANKSASPAATDAGGIADAAERAPQDRQHDRELQERRRRRRMANGTATSSAAHAPRSDALHDTASRSGAAGGASTSPSIVIGPSPTPTMKQRAADLDEID